MAPTTGMKQGDMACLSLGSPASLLSIHLLSASLALWVTFRAPSTQLPSVSVDSSHFSSLKLASFLAAWILQQPLTILCLSPYTVEKPLPAPHAPSCPFHGLVVSTPTRNKHEVLPGWPPGAYPYTQLSQSTVSIPPTLHSSRAFSLLYQDPSS